jgi:hypothetical protein
VISPGVTSRTVLVIISGCRRGWTGHEPQSGDEALVREDVERAPLRCVEL